MHGKTHKHEGMRRTYWYAAMSEDAVQRSPSTVLRAVSLSNGRWTFYEVVKINRGVIAWVS